MNNQTLKQGLKNTARLEQERSFRGSVVYIDSISPDQTRALVHPQAGAIKSGEQFQVRILNTPGLSLPLDVTNYVGILHGDPKNPIGVELFSRATMQPNIDHSIPNSTYGQSGDKKTTDVVGKAKVADDTITRKINNRRYPMDHTVVVKPPKAIPLEHIGSNRITSDAPGNIIDSQGAYVSVSEDEVRLIGDEANGVIINPHSGISFYGKMNIGTSMQDVRIGGAWKVNPILQYQIPSTAVTPQPTFIWDPPGLDITQGLGDIIDAISNM